MAGWLAGQKTTAQRLNDNAPFTVAYAAITATTATTTGAELVAITTPNMTFRNNRAYRIIYKGGMTSSTATQQGTVLVRKATVTGTSYINGFRLYLPAAGTIPFYLANICTNTSGADITTTLVGTFGLTVSVSAGTVNLFGSTANPTYIEVTDIGLASDYPGATAI